MTGKVRAKQLAYLEQRYMVAMLNTLRWAKYAMYILEQQCDLAQEGLTRRHIAERIKRLRAQGIFALAKTEREDILRKQMESMR